MSNLFIERMTLQEIADVTGVSRLTVTRLVQEIYPSIIRNGITTKLTKDQSEVVIKSLKFKGVLEPIQNEEVKNQASGLVSSKTELEIMQAGLRYIQWMQSKIIELEKQKQEDLPKIEFHDAVANVEGKRKVGDASKELKLLSPNKLFAQLRNDKILMKDNLPYQGFIERGYFEVNVTLKNDQTYSTTYVTNKGMIWLEKKYKNLIGLK